jgi:NAD(P)-dependent dehydrogenase (short-subunit alcohol dehydrogenase family)
MVFQYVLNGASLAVAVALIMMAIDFYSCPVYVVHKTGTIIISGASTGIGRHAAEELAERGYHVFAGVRNEKDQKDIANMNVSTLHPLMLDVTSQNSCEEAVRTVTEFNRLHDTQLVAVVNNAGIARLQTAEFWDIDDAHKVFETNFFGALRLTQLTLPLLRQSHGRVVMISSITGFFNIPLYSVYGASKYAMEGLSDALRREVQPFGVSVSVVEPGSVRSAIQGKFTLENDVNLLSASGMRQEIVEKNKFDTVAETYPHIYNEKVRRKLKARTSQAEPTTVTTKAIVESITSSKPKTRYVVAKAGALPGWLMRIVVWLLPDRAVDYMVTKS